MGATSGIVTGLVALGSGGAGAVVAAAIAGAVGDEVAANLFSASKKKLKAIADPAAQPGNHHFLRVIRTARLKAFKRLALETRDALNITREASPFLRDLENWIDLERDLDVNKALDPRALAERKDPKPPEAGDLTGIVRGAAAAAQAMRGLFVKASAPVAAEAFFTAPDKMALLGMEAFFYSDARMEAGLAADDAVAVRQNAEQAGLRGAIEVAAFGEMVIATEAEDVVWSGGPMEDFYRRFHDRVRGFFATMRNEIQAFMVEDEAFRSRFAALMSVEQSARLRDMSAQLEALRAELKTEREAGKSPTSETQVEGVLTEVLRAGLPADAFEAAFRGGRQELINLGKQLEAVSNRAGPDLQYLRDQAHVHIEAGRLSEARSTLLELRARQREIRRGISLEEANTESELGRLANASARYIEAADHFAAAAELARPFDLKVWARYKCDEADAAGNFGKTFPDQGALTRAVAAYDAALASYETPDTLEVRTGTQNNLAIVLGTLGARLGGETGAAYSRRAIDVYERVISLYARFGTPAQKSLAQNNLGCSLRRQGDRTPGRAGVKLLRDAVATFESALMVRTRAALPVEWAITQHNLGNALGALGARLSGSRRKKVLERAVVSFEGALAVYDQRGMRVDWAMTQSSLGNAHRELASHLVGKERVERLGQAVEAYNAALEVQAKGQRTIVWASTQFSLGCALSELGSCLEGQAGAALLERAAVAFKSALMVRTKAELPVQWAETQNGLGGAFFALGEASVGEAKPARLAQAMEAFEAALTVANKYNMPVTWASVQHNLGLLYEALADISAREEARANLINSVAALERAHTVYTLEHGAFHFIKVLVALDRIRFKLDALGPK